MIRLEIKKLSENDNKFIGRKEIKFEVAYAEAPPKRMDIRAEIAKHLNLQPEVVAITKIKNIFGLRKNVVYVNVYNDVNEAKLIIDTKIIEADIQSFSGINNNSVRGTPPNTTHLNCMFQLQVYHH